MWLRGFAAAALFLSACAAPAGARSPALVPVGAVAGDWTLALSGAAACRLTLRAEPSPHGHRAHPIGPCASPIAQWRPVPDGLELAGVDGLTLILLNPVGPDRYDGRDAAGRAARLTR